MSRKVYVEVKVKVIIQADEGIDINDVIEDMDYEFNSQTDGADVVSTEIMEQTITDSK
jgi:hypothetical protein